MINPFLIDLLKVTIPNFILLVAVVVIMNFKQKVEIRYIFASDILGVRVTDKPVENENKILRLYLVKDFSKDYFGLKHDTFNDNINVLVQYFSEDLWVSEKPIFQSKIKEITDKKLKSFVEVLDHGFDDLDPLKISLHLKILEKSNLNNVGRSYERIVHFTLIKDLNPIKEKGPLKINKYAHLIDSMEIEVLK